MLGNILWRLTWYFTHRRRIRASARDVLPDYTGTAALILTAIIALGMFAAFGVRAVAWR